MHPPSIPVHPHPHPIHQTQIHPIRPLHPMVATQGFAVPNSLTLTRCGDELWWRLSDWLGWNLKPLRRADLTFGGFVVSWHGIIEFSLNAVRIALWSWHILEKLCGLVSYQATVSFSDWREDVDSSSGKMQEDYVIYDRQMGNLTWASLTELTCNFDFHEASKVTRSCKSAFFPPSNQQIESVKSPGSGTATMLLWLTRACAMIAFPCRSDGRSSQGHGNKMQYIAAGGPTSLVAGCQLQKR